MTPAELKTIREGLGFSERDVSMLTLATEAEIKAWEQGSKEIPERDAGLLMDVERELERRLAEALDRVSVRDKVILKRFKTPLDFKKSGPDMYPIPPMLAYRCHCMLINRLYRALQRQGKQVAVIYA